MENVAFLEEGKVVLYEKAEIYFKNSFFGVLAGEFPRLNQIKINQLSKRYITVNQITMEHI